MLTHIQTNWFLGEPTKGEFRAASMPEFTLWASKVPKGVDIIEICGGEGRPSQVCLRRHLK
eukprot:9526364-Lingulodinium_polyedra.AAC.1